MLLEVVGAQSRTFLGIRRWYTESYVSLLNLTVSRPTNALGKLNALHLHKIMCHYAQEQEHVLMHSKQITVALVLTMAESVECVAEIGLHYVRQ
jgi:hypothetical protein